MQHFSHTITAAPISVATAQSSVRNTLGISITRMSHTMPPPLTLIFDEIIEVVLGQSLIRSRVEWVTAGRRKIRRLHPHFRLALADAFYLGYAQV
jgi:hypothetical protein